MGRPHTLELHDEVVHTRAFEVVDDLFGVVGPVPWSDAPGFLQSEAWRAYCEAWECATADPANSGFEPGIVRAAEKSRGIEQADALRANIKLARSDIAGRVVPRSRLSELLK
jgi:hypothetical protein